VREPIVHLREALGPQAIDAALCLDLRFDELGLSKNAQVPRHGGTADRKTSGDRAGVELAIRQQVEDLAPDRIR
jgi:hypothetical protein